MIFQSHCAGCERVGPVLCRTCRFALARPSSLPHSRDVIAAVPFTGRARDVLLGFKYGNRRQLSHHLAGLLVNRLISAGVRPADLDVVTWAPTSTRRRYRRGFDQAEVVARRVAAQLGLPCRRLLERDDGGAPQTGRDRRPSTAWPGVPGRARRRRPASAGRRRRRHHRIDVAVGGGRAARRRRPVGAAGGGRHHAGAGRSTRAERRCRRAACLIVSRRAPRAVRPRHAPRSGRRRHRCLRCSRSRRGRGSPSASLISAAKPGAGLIGVERQRRTVPRHRDRPAGRRVGLRERRGRDR